MSKKLILAVTKVSRTGAILVLFVFALFLPSSETRVLSAEVIPLVRKTELDEFTPSLYPRKVLFSEEPPEIWAAAAIVRDNESGVVLYSKNPQLILRPASITKLMTALTALEYYHLDDILTVKRLVRTRGESGMGLAVGDKVTVANLLYGLLVPSGNDAAYTLADNYPGGIENFIYSMNKMAKKMNMENTHFSNPSGLDQDYHYSTAWDISLLAMEAIKNPFIAKAVATYGITLSDFEGKKFYSVKNVNQFLNYLFGADGIKTGYTDLAGECLVASVSRDGHKVISVVLKSRDRFSDSARLLEWAYRNFIWTNINDFQN